MIKAVVFDFDDVIVDTQKIKFSAYSKVLKSYGIAITEEEYVKEWKKTSNGVKSILEKNKNKLDFETFREESTRIYLEFLQSKLKPIEGAIEVLGKIKLKKGLASNSKEEHVAYSGDKLKIRDMFDAIVTGSDVSRPKPDPEIYLAVANLLGIKAQKCLAVDDHIVGIKAAKAAGMITAAIPHGYSQDQDFSEADFVLKGIKDVPKLIEQLNR